MKVDGQHYRTVWMENSSVFMIQQNLLPFQFQIYEAKSCHDTCEAIKTMIVRGAGAIGAAAGFALAQAFREGKDDGNSIQRAKQEIESTRPTAYNLFHATNLVFDAGIKSSSPHTAARSMAQNLANENVEQCRKIGEIGSKLISKNCKLETHCNAGWLAFVDYGTALSPMYHAHQQGKDMLVYVDETRPRNQGALLTAWELHHENIPHLIIPDNAGAYLMSQKKVDLVIVGADRIACNGDVANKIGTLEKAIVAREYGVPFFVAAPTSTIDPGCESGAGITIEERSHDEVLYQRGLDEGKVRSVLVSSPGSRAFNPAFDVTPAKYITGIITEKGIVSPAEVNKLLP